MQTPEETSVATPAAATPVNPLERRLDISLPTSIIDDAVDKRLKTLVKTTKMAGFRPGKVPIKLVAQKYGAQIRAEATVDAVEEAFAQRVQNEKLKVAGGTRIEPGKGDDGHGQSHFSVVFEVFPEFSLGDISSRCIEKPILTVGDAEIDKTIEALREQRISWIAVDRPATKGDRLVIDFSAQKDGQPLKKATANDFTIKLGDGRMLPDFEAGIEGMSAGETKVYPVSFPADYHATDLAGQTVEFTVTAKRIEEAKLPELNEEFARQLGISDGDLTKMRSEVRSNLEREVKKRLEARVKHQVMEALLAANPIPVPRSLVEDEAKRMAQKALQDMQGRGFMAQNMPIEASWFTSEAERRVRLGLVMAEMVRAHSVEAKPEQVRAIVEDFAESFEQPQDVVRWYYSQPERMAEAEALALENNVVAWVLSQAQVNEKVVDFDELMGKSS